MRKTFVIGTSEFDSLGALEQILFFEVKDVNSH